ncbi:MAG TPA: hypothetical protein PLL64_12175 [Rhodothermales bacterium]|nr:hypothetical protein [Rhodothermales bacterium]HRR07648.1 hypothetical protein [Rhodothermales bacterium]
MKKVVIAWLFWAMISGCSPTSDPDLLPVNLNKSDQERLLLFYLGGYAAPEGQDPIKAGILVKDGTSFFIRKSALKAVSPDAAAQLPADKMDWNGLKSWVGATYNRARNIPISLSSFLQQVAYKQGFKLSVSGVMTTAIRDVYVPESALRAALASYKENGKKLLYPVGTTFVGEHREEGNWVETTIMKKRRDGFWDYWVYNQAGNLAEQTLAKPQSLKSPVQCVGCHFGSRQFEPHKSFPNPAPLGANGTKRELYLNGKVVPAALITYFKEHAKRSDTILGPYATLFVSGLLEKRQIGTASEADLSLIKSLGL